MKMIGLIGGMSWESSAEYYRLLNQGVRDRTGPLASARCILWSFDFSEIAALQKAGDWDALTRHMVQAARALEAGGVDAILICTNTMHKLAAEVEAAVSIPLLHIVDPAAEQAKAMGAQRVALLGTAFTMEQDFYKNRLRERHGLDVIIPDVDDRAQVHRIIYDELVAGVITPQSRAIYRGIIARLVEQGAQAVILGCTEIMLLVQAEDSAVPLLDTTSLHVDAAIDFALGGVQASEG
ncbi:MAG: aspartate/glutamate racemase family protein [Sphingobium sp.]|nr:aspartate/glutamate racemase family protein [Sphingobium sp.]